MSRKSSEVGGFAVGEKACECDGRVTLGGWSGALGTRDRRQIRGRLVWLVCKLSLEQGPKSKDPRGLANVGNSHPY